MKKLLSSVLILVVLAMVMAIVEFFAPDDPVAKKVLGLSSGDIVAIERNEGVAQLETFMVVFDQRKWDSRPRFVGPGPGSNKEYRMRDLAFNGELVGIIKKDDPGWQEQATWFYLQ